MSQLNLYDENAALNHVKILEFKRLAGTKGEVKTLNYIQKELNKSNIEPTLESFEWTKSTSILMKLAFLFVFCYVLLYEIILLFPGLTWTILLFDILLVIIIMKGVKFLFDMSRITYIGKRKESKNVIARINGTSPMPRKPIIIFSAHYDSISLAYPYKMILSLYLSGGLLILVYLLATLILSVWSLLSLFSLAIFNDIYLLIKNITLLIGLIIMVIISLILLNRRTNKSTGSIDNATGVAILIEIAKLVKDNPLKNIDTLFLFCGAEEWGLWGSKTFCRDHFDDLDLRQDIEKSFNINIDMVGTYIGLVDKTGLIKKKELNPSLNNILEASAKQQNIVLDKSFIPIGAGSDHMSFKSFSKKYDRLGFQVCCFLSHKDGKFIHSAKDKAENCSSENLNGCISICYNAIKSLDLRAE